MLFGFATHRSNYRLNHNRILDLVIFVRTNKEAETCHFSGGFLKRTLQNTINRLRA